MHTHSVVVRSLIRRATMTGFQSEINTPSISGVLADFLEQLIEIDQGKTYGKVKDDFRESLQPSSNETELGGRIEKLILGGKIRVEKSSVTGYPTYKYRPNGWKRDLALANSSSMVSELAPIVLYLRYLVKSGDLLIIEEPESHLHPGAQVELVRQIALLVEAGVRVLLTTHSEWVLEELSNVVQRSRIPQTERVGQEDSAVALTSDKVGVWQFVPRKRPTGSVVQEVRVAESGLYSTDFDDVAIALHNDWAGIVDWMGEADR